MLNIPVDELRMPGAPAPLGARDAWCRCRTLTWEIRQRARLEPLDETLRRLPAAHAYVGGDSTRLFFATLAGAYAACGVPLAPLPQTPAMLELRRQIETQRAAGAAVDAPVAELTRLRAAEMQAELELLRAAVADEVRAWKQLEPALTVQCPFTGEVAMLLNDGRVAMRLD